MSKSKANKQIRSIKTTCSNHWRQRCSKSKSDASCSLGSINVRPQQLLHFITKTHVSINLDKSLCFDCAAGARWSWVVVVVVVEGKKFIAKRPKIRIRSAVGSPHYWSSLRPSIFFLACTILPFFSRTFPRKILSQIIPGGAHLIVTTHTTKISIQFGNHHQPVEL